MIDTLRPGASTRRADTFKRAARLVVDTHGVVQGKQEIAIHIKDDPAKYVVAFAGSDIETNPPATNEAVEAGGRSVTRAVDLLPPAEVLAEIDRVVDMDKLEETLMREGVLKFAEPQKALLSLIAAKRAALKPMAARS